MKSKISFFNRTIYKKNLVLFWPIWGSFFLFELFQGPLYLWLHFGKPRGDKLSILVASINARMNIFALAAASLIIGMALFNYLFTSKSANMIHALPVTRPELFGTNLISGFTFLFIPEIVSFFLSVLVCLANGVAEVQYLGMWLLVCLGISFFFFSLVAFCAMFTGQLFALPVYFVICNILVEGITTGVSWLVSKMAYGVNSTSFGGKLRFLSPILYLLDEVKLIGSYSNENNRDIYEMTDIQMFGGRVVLCYAAAALIFYLAAYYGYRKRQIESAGDLLTFYWIRPIFRWGVGVCFGFLGGTVCMYFMRDMAYLSNWVWAVLVLVCGIVSFFIAEMLIQKAFRVLNARSCKECGVFACFLSLVFAGIYGYAYAQAHYIPEADSVAYAYVDMNYPVEFEGEEIGEVLALQREIISKQKQIEKELEANEIDNGSGYVTFTYRMKDGSTQSRGYSLPSAARVSDDMLGRIAGWESEEDNFLRQYIEYDYAGVTRVTDAQLEWYHSDSMSYVYHNVEGEGAKALFDAILADAAEGVLQKYNRIDYREAATERTLEPYAQLYVYYYHREDGWQSMYDRMNDRIEKGDGPDIYADGPGAGSRGGIYITFGADCRNIIQALLDNGIIESEDEIEYMSDDMYY